MVGFAVLLLLVWLVSFLVFKVSSFLIHLLLIAAAVVFIARMVRGRAGAGTPT
jgi:hypothetical protein